MLDADAELADASHITGTVSAGVDAPLGGISVAAYQELFDEGQSYWQAVEYADTDDTGAYDLGGLAAGDYRIGFSDDSSSPVYATEYYDDVPSLLSATDVTVGEAGLTSGIDAELVESSQITGTVTNAAGDGIGDAAVYTYVQAGDEWDYVSQAFTDAEGRYTTDGLAKGTYRVEFDASTDDTLLYEFWKDAGRLDEADDIAVGDDVSISAIDAQLIEDEFETKYLERLTQPTLTGVAQVGSTLTATAGTYSPAPSSIRIQWLRGWEAIAGATSWSYTLTAADEGEYISFVTFASLDGYQEDSNGPEYVGPVAAAPAPAPARLRRPPPRPRPSRRRRPAPAPAPAPPPAPGTTISFPKSMDVAGALKVGSTLKLKNYQGAGLALDGLVHVPVVRRQQEDQEGDQDQAQGHQLAQGQEDLGEGDRHVGHHREDRQGQGRHDPLTDAAAA